MLSIEEVAKRLPELYRQVQCLKKELGELSIVNSIDDFLVNGNNLDLIFTHNEDGQITLSANLLPLQQLEIKDNVLNFNALSSVINPDLYQFAYVRESQGIQWINYKGSGLYMWNGATWVEDDTDIFTQLETILNTLSVLQTDLNNKANTADLGATAFSNDYNDLNNLPTILTPPVSSVNGEVGTVSLKSFDFTHWNSPLGGGIFLPNNSSFNLFEGVLPSEKLPVSATGLGALNIINGPGEDYIQTNWLGVIESLEIRIIIEVAQGGTDFYRLRLRRKSDDSIISVHPIQINSGDVPENTLIANINTYVGEPTDSFVTGGFYIDFANNSGGNAILLDSINILIKRNYKQPINNI